MDALKDQWARGVREVKSITERTDAAPPARSASDISRKDLLQLTMKLSARLKAAERAHRDVVGRARDAERDRDALKAFTAGTVLGTPGVLDDVPLDEAALTQLWGRQNTGDADAQATALKEALARALSARDAEASRAAREASKRQDAAAKAEERIVALELKLRDARRDAMGAPEARASGGGRAPAVRGRGDGVTAVRALDGVGQERPRVARTTVTDQRARGRETARGAWCGEGEHSYLDGCLGGGDA